MDDGCHQFINLAVFKKKKEVSENKVDQWGYVNYYISMVKTNYLVFFLIITNIQPSNLLE